jgi:hypothetical protein
VDHQQGLECSDRIDHRRNRPTAAPVDHYGSHDNRGAHNDATHNRAYNHIDDHAWGDHVDDDSGSDHDYDDSGATTAAD